MDKLRKYFWIPLVLAILVVIILVWARMPGPLSTRQDLMRAVPSQAAVLVKSRNIEVLFDGIRQENPIWDELTALPEIGRFNQLLSGLDSLVNRYPEMVPFFSRQSCVFAFYPLTDTRASFLLVTGPVERPDARRLLDLLGSLGDSISLEKRSYEQTEIYQFRLPFMRSELRYHISFSDGLFLLSSSAVMAEDAIRQLSLPTGLPELKGYQQVAATAGKNVEANIFINLSRVGPLFSILLNQEYDKKLREMTPAGEWAELDLYVKDDALLFNGFSFAGDSAAYLMNLFKGQPAQERKIEEALPANTVWFASMGVGDLGKYWERFDQQLLATGRDRPVRIRSDEIEQGTGEDVRDWFAPLFDHEAALVRTDTRNVAASENLFAVVSVKSQRMAEEQVGKLIRSYCSRNNRSVSAYEEAIRIDRETAFTCWQLPYDGLPALLLGRLFSGVPFRYVTVVGNHMIFGNSTEALSGFIHQNILGRTLQNDLMYADFSDYLSNRYHFHFFVNLPRVGQVIPEFFSPEVSGNLDKHQVIFQKLQGLAFQFSADQQMGYNNLLLKYSPVYREITRTVWESLLDTAVRTKPQLVVNHYTGDREILVQDVANNLYLLNAAGRILWKLPLKEPIMGEVFQIDYYRNGKLQYLFNTRHQLHLIDRNGNYVERYPVDLRSPATSPMALFDYDNNGDYRIFIATEDLATYAYDKEGSLVSGWDAAKTEHRVTRPIQHFRLGSLDYLVFHDSYRTYILDRRGNPRVTPAEQFPHSQFNNLILDERSGSQARLVTTDEQGKVYFLYFNGKVESVDLGTFSPSHYFNYTDLDGNGSKEYIFLDGKKLEVFGSDRQPRFSMEFEQAVDQPMNIYQFSRTDNKIGVVVSSQNRIYLINPDGKLYKGFPLLGSSPFTIGKLRESSARFNLVVGGRDNFLMNYSVQ